MQFERTILHDLVGSSTTELLETLVSKGQIVGIDWNPIVRVQIPSGARIFSESTFLPEFT